MCLVPFMFAIYKDILTMLFVILRFLTVVFAALLQQCGDVELAWIEGREFRQTKGTRKICSFEQYSFELALGTCRE